MSSAATCGVRAWTSEASTACGLSARCVVVRMTLARICWLFAPAQDRLPPHTLRVTTAGRIACSARQLVASIDGSNRKDQIAVNSRAKWRAKRAHQMRTGLCEPRGQARDQIAAGDGQAVRGDRPRLIPIAHGERLLQDRLDVGPEGAMGMIGRDHAAPPEQMRQTGLVRGGGELPIGRPPIADEDAREVGPQDVGRLLEAAAGLNAIDGRGGGRKGPQPLQQSATFQPVSSGLTVGLPRTCAHNAS